MPVTIHTGYLNVRDDNGEYIRYNTVAEETVQEMVEDIEAKGAEVRDSIPDDYTALSDEVDAIAVEVKDGDRGLYNSIYGTNGIPLTPQPLTINSSGNWAVKYTDHICIPVNPGDTVAIKARTTANAFYAQLKSDVAVFNSSPTYATGETGRHSITAGTTTTITAAADCYYVYLSYSSHQEGATPVTYYPESVKVNGVEQNVNVLAYVDQIVGNVSDALDDLTTTVGDISDTVDDLTDDVEANTTAIQATNDTIEDFVTYAAPIVAVDLKVNPNFASTVATGSEGGYYNGSGTWTTDTAFTTCYFEAQETDYTIYFDECSDTSSSGPYIQLSLFNGTAIKANWVGRYRTRDGNIPTALQPMTVLAGYTAAVTFYTNHSSTPNANVYTNWDQAAVYTFTPMANEMINDAIVSDNKECFFRYVNGSGDSESTERIEVFIPTKTAYVKYQLVHTVKANRNANVWRMSKAYLANSLFMAGDAVIVEGEWECALQLQGRDDASGGYLHGDEIVDAITLIVDGAQINMANYTALTSFTKMEIIQASTLYDPNDSVTAVAKHGSNHVFTADGLHIHQSVQWLGAYTTAQCYLAMFPAAKAAFTKWYTDNRFIVGDLPTTSGYDSVVYQQPITSVSLFNDTTGVKGDFGIVRYPSGLTPQCGQFQLQDNNGGAYHKCYFAVTKVGNNYQTSENEIWLAETRFSVSY